MFLVNLQLSGSEATSSLVIHPKDNGRKAVVFYGSAESLVAPPNDVCIALAGGPATV